MTTPDINRYLRQHPRNSKYGAPMGARSVCADDDQRLYLQRVYMVDGDYAPDGTYWGGGRDVEPLYCAWSPDGATTIYVRARYPATQ